MPAGLAIEWALVPIGFLGALIYGVTGFGSALVTIPLATHFVPLPFALAVFVLQDFASALRVADADTLIVADGTSCRHQIHDGSQREAIHVARVVARALD